VSESRQRLGIGRWRPVLAASGALLLTAIAVWRTSAPSRPEGSVPTVTIAVLPFAHYSTDLISSVAGGSAHRRRDGRARAVRDGRRRVAHERDSVRRNAKATQGHCARVKCDGVVEASVDVDGDIVRVQARLVDAVIDRKSFSQAFEGSRAALPDLQQRIATAIEKGAQLTLIRSRH